MQFLYMGFTQQENIRCYRFEGVVPKERPTQVTKNIDFRLSADMSMLAEYHIQVQDGPALCLQVLSAASAGEANNAAPFASYDITREDLSAFASARSAIEKSKIARRKARPGFKPAASSHLKWPRYK